MRPRGRRMAPVWLALLGALVPLAGLPAAAQDREADPTTARAFEVVYRPLADAYDLVEPLLTGEGTVTLRPRLSTLVVEDRRFVLAGSKGHAGLNDDRDAVFRWLEARCCFPVGNDPQMLADALGRKM